MENSYNIMLNAELHWYRSIRSAIARTKADNQKFWWVADFAAFDR